MRCPLSRCFLCEDLGHRRTICARCRCARTTGCGGLQVSSARINDALSEKIRCQRIFSLELRTRLPIYSVLLAARAVTVKVSTKLRLGNQERGLCGDVTTCPMPAKRGPHLGTPRRACERDRGERSRYNEGLRLLNRSYFWRRPPDPLPDRYLLLGVGQKRNKSMNTNDEQTAQQQRQRGFWGKLKNRKVLKIVLWCGVWAWRIFRFLTGDWAALFDD